VTDGTQPAMLVLSGGEGYIDFRVGKQIFVILVARYVVLIINLNKF